MANTTTTRRSGERDLILIDYGDDLSRPPGKWRNRYEVTEEFACHNGHYGTREDVVFLVNGIPVLVIECKNASKDEGIALGVDQIRRYLRKIKAAFVEFPNWQKSEGALRELRKKVTFAIYSALDDLEQVTTLVDDLFRLLEMAERI